MPDTQCSQIFLGRQPILGREQQLLAYELLFREGPIFTSNRADIIDPNELPKGIVVFGAKVRVKDLDSGKVLITSQNHGFAVDPSSMPENLRVTHVSLFDGTNQGIARTDVPAYSFQGHPEASPGPHDVAYLFDRFIGLMEAAR